MIYPEYIATRDGRIYSLRRDKYLSVRKGRAGYYLANLCIGAKCKTISVHRYIAEYFIPNPDNKPCVNHKNGIKTDNRVENLEWVTYKENSKHAFENHLVNTLRGIETHNGRFTDEDIKRIRTEYANGLGSHYVFAKKYGVTRAAIQQILNRSTYKHVD